MTKLPRWSSPPKYQPPMRWRDQTSMWLRMGYLRVVHPSGLVQWIPPVMAHREGHP